MKLFRGGLVFKAQRLFVSLNSWLESNKEEANMLTYHGMQAEEAEGPEALKTSDSSASEESGGSDASAEGSDDDGEFSIPTAHAPDPKSETRNSKPDHLNPEPETCNPTSGNPTL